MNEPKSEMKKKWETMYRKEDEQSSAVRVVGSSIEIVNAGAHWRKVGFVILAWLYSKWTGPFLFRFRNW